MTSQHYQNIENEIHVHPKEREGFNRSDIEKLPSDEIEDIKLLLLEQIKEGNFRCCEPLEWLTKTKYVETLNQCLKGLTVSDHGYINLSVLLFEHTNDRGYLNNLIKGIKEGESSWSGRRMALGMYAKRHLEILSFKQLCWELMCNDANSAMRKFAGRKLAELQLEDPSFDDFQYIEGKVSSPLEKEAERLRIQNDLHRFLKLDSNFAII